MARGASAGPSGFELFTSEALDAHKLYVVEVRHPVEVPVIVVLSQGEELKATATNVSEGGMAVHFQGNLPKTGIAKIIFTLPGMHWPMEPKVDLAWADGNGCAGLRFSEMPENSQQQLERWLCAQMEKIEQQAQ